MAGILNRQCVWEHETAFGWWGMKNVLVRFHFWPQPVSKKICCCSLAGCCRRLFNLLGRRILQAGGLLKCLLTGSRHFLIAGKGQAGSVEPGTPQEEIGQLDHRILGERTVEAGRRWGGEEPPFLTAGIPWDGPWCLEGPLPPEIMHCSCSKGRPAVASGFCHKMTRAYWAWKPVLCSSSHLGGKKRSKWKERQTDLWQGTCGVTLDYCVLKQHWLLWFSSFRMKKKTSDVWAWSAACQISPKLNSETTFFLCKKFTFSTNIRYEPIKRNLKTWRFSMGHKTSHVSQEFPHHFSSLFAAMGGPRARDTERALHLCPVP